MIKNAALILMEVYITRYFTAMQITKLSKCHRKIGLANCLWVFQLHAVTH